MNSPDAATREEALTNTVLLSLALAGGVLDVTSYLAFGKIFVANMTGNTVLLGAAVAQGVNVHALRAIVALAGYCLGTFTGALLIPDRSRAWPASARPALELQFLALAASLVIWAVFGVGADRYELIALGGVIMGLQSATALASGVSGVNTTYMTGTLTTTLSRLARRVRPGPNPRHGPALGGSAWITYGIGAVVGAVTVRSWHSAVLTIPLVMVGAIWLCARLQPDHRSRSPRRPLLRRPTAGSELRTPKASPSGGTPCPRRPETASPSRASCPRPSGAQE